MMEKSAEGPVANSVMKLRAHRATQIVRTEQADIEVTLRPKVLLDEQTSEERRDIMARVGKLDPGHFRMTSYGEIAFRDDYWGQFFDIESREASDWIYAGGEVDTISERYDSGLEWA